MRAVTATSVDVLLKTVAKTRIDQSVCARTYVYIFIYMQVRVYNCRKFGVCSELAALRGCNDERFHAARDFVSF